MQKSHNREQFARPMLIVFYCCLLPPFLGGIRLMLHGTYRLVLTQLTYLYRCPRHHAPSGGIRSLSHHAYRPVQTKLTYLYRCPFYPYPSGGIRFLSHDAYRLVPAELRATYLGDYKFKGTSVIAMGAITDVRLAHRPFPPGQPVGKVGASFCAPVGGLLG